jgi:SecD/SecF fusion protein
MRNYTLKIVLILACVLMAGYFLWPTYQDYRLQRELRELHGEDSIAFLEANDQAIRDARTNRIKLGLDLQGGMRVTLEVNVLKLMDDLAKNKDDAFTQIMNEVREESKRSEESPVLILRRKFEERQIRMSRYYGSLRDDNDKIFAFLQDESEKAIDRGIEIVRNRVDQYGVSEPTIQKLGANRIIAELPGVSKESEVRQLLQGTALLEFKLLKEPDVTVRICTAIDNALAQATAADTTDTSTVAKAIADTTLSQTDTTKISTPEGELSPEQFARKHPFFAVALFTQQYPGEALVVEENRDKVRRMLERPEVKRIIPGDAAFAWSAKPQVTSVGKRYYFLYLLKSTPELTGGVVVNAKATLDPSNNLPIVTMEMNSEGSRDWARITGANVKKRIAISLDNAIFSAPEVRNKIIGGRSQIEGMDNLEEARLLEIVLKAGALPAPVDIAEQRSVGPSLGEDSIRSGVLSSVIATMLTILFMIFYYRTGGVVADVAVLFCMVFLLGVLAAFKATLTLPGIAGVILTLAVSVDANVLINERIRDEQATGKTLRASIDAGYARAWTAIFDSNLTTFISGVILYQFGSGAVQGFALTLMIGIVTSMFAAVFITRVIFTVMGDRYSVRVNFG